MIETAPGLLTRYEEFGRNNTRFLGYHFLQDLTYLDEPIVPRIICEGSNSGKYYTLVEEIPGKNMMDLMYLNIVPLRKMLQIYDVVIGQLKTVDKAGLVLFDRANRNTMVAQWRDRISVRQIDLEEFYDPKMDAVYSDRTQEDNEKEVEIYKKLGVSMWAQSVSYVSGDIKKVLRRAGREDLERPYQKYDRLWPGPQAREFRGQNLLDMLGRDLSVTLQRV